MAHNHPSGIPKPSQAKPSQAKPSQAKPSQAKRVTIENLKKALTLIDMHLLDHVIISDPDFFHSLRRGSSNSN